MKALTICQPYAELIARAEHFGPHYKLVENRTWHCGHRGPLLIHAGKAREWLSLGPGGDRDLQYDIPLSQLDFGAIIARAMLIDCIHVDRIRSGAADFAFPWLRDHEHVSGPYCLILSNVRRLPKPITWRGAQGLFDIPDHAVGAAPAAGPGLF